MPRPRPITHGVDPATHALAALLTSAGFRGAGDAPPSDAPPSDAPPSDAPVSEALAAVVGGGLGFGALFAPRGSPVRWFLSGRHLWQSDLGYLLAASERLGLQIARFEHDEPGVSGVILDQWIQAPDPCVVAWADASLLPWHALEAEAPGRWPRVVLLRGFGPGGVLVEDAHPEPRSLDHPTLARARAALPRHRHRLLRVAAAPAHTDVRTFIAPGLAVGVATLRHGAGQGLGALRTWADALLRVDPFRAQVPDPPDLLDALLDLRRAVHRSGGLLRGLFADGLTEASALLQDTALRDLRDDYAGLARAWAALADSCLPSDEGFGEVQHLAGQIDRAVAHREDPEQLADLRAALAERKGELALSWHPTHIDDHLVAIGQQLYALADREDEAASAVEAWLAGRG